MAFPPQSAVEIPLLKSLVESGGSAKPRDVYARVAACFPDLTPIEQEQRLESSPSTRKWWNLVQWVRQHLVEAGEIDGSTRGLWTITPKGRARLVGPAKAIPTNAQAAVVRVEASLRDLVNRSREEVKSRLLTELKGLTPTGFEHFCMELLQQLGYRNGDAARKLDQYAARKVIHRKGVYSTPIGCGDSKTDPSFPFF